MTDLRSPKGQGRARVDERHRAQHPVADPPGITGRKTCGEEDRGQGDFRIADPAFSDSHILAHGHIRGLDGLRAIAIIAVFIYHLGFSWLPGGYLGVDVFFVLSGFLITTLLIREFSRDGRIDLRGFWLRRARRLLPALIIVVTTSVALAFIIGGDLLVNIRRQVAGALTFSNNWVEIAAGSSYFNATAPQLFVNFWSLAVEEQFYLLWPLMFVIIMTFTAARARRVGIVAGGALISALAMAWIFTPGVDATRVYYGTDTHAFGLLFGAALALAATVVSTDVFSRRWLSLLRVPLGSAALAILTVMLMVLRSDAAFTYRGGIVLTSAAVTVLIATLPGSPTIITRALDSVPMRWIGERSYGIYLWHWPVILMISAALPPVPTNSPWLWSHRVLAVFVTLVVAGLSFSLVERPIRVDGFRATFARWRVNLGAPWAWDRPRFVVVGAGAVMILFIAGLVTAPDKSQVELAMERAQEIVNQPSLDADPVPTEDPIDPESSPPGYGSVPAGEVPSGDLISSFGDSMLYVAAPGIADSLPGIAIDAESNRQWPQIATAIREAVEAGTVREFVVIAAGTNAGVREPQIVRDTLDTLGPHRKVVLVNIYGSSYWVPESNENLDDIAAEYSNVVVADWNAAATAHPDQLQPDRIHPNMSGMALYADVITDALADVTDANR